MNKLQKLEKMEELLEEAVAISMSVIGGIPDNEFSMNLYQSLQEVKDMIEDLED